MYYNVNLVTSRRSCKSSPVGNASFKLEVDNLLLLQFSTQEQVLSSKKSPNEDSISIIKRKKENFKTKK
jgi:hypothetical protein